jgi:hypothetical protein
MSEQNSTVQDTESVNGKERAAHKGTFATLADAKQIKPPSDRFRVFLVTDDDGKQVYSWGQNGDLAIATAARTTGWTAEVADKGAGVITKDRVAAKLAEFSDAELAELGLKRAKGKK